MGFFGLFPVVNGRSAPHHARTDRQLYWAMYPFAWTISVSSFIFFLPLSNQFTPSNPHHASLVEGGKRGGLRKRCINTEEGGQVWLTENWAGWECEIGGERRRRWRGDQRFSRRKGRVAQMYVFVYTQEVKPPWLAHSKSIKLEKTNSSDSEINGHKSLFECPSHTAEDIHNHSVYRCGGACFTPWYERSNPLRRGLYEAQRFKQTSSAVSPFLPTICCTVTVIWQNKTATFLMTHVSIKTNHEVKRADSRAQDLAPGTDLEEATSILIHLNQMGIFSAGLITGSL